MGTSSANITSVNRFVTATCLQICNNLCVFTRVHVTSNVTQTRIYDSGMHDKKIKERVLHTVDESRSYHFAPT